MPFFLYYKDPDHDDSFDFREFKTEEDVIEYINQHIAENDSKFTDFRVVEGVERKLEPRQKVTVVGLTPR